MKLKRILATILCFAMVFGTISFSAFAEEVKTDRQIYLEVTPEPSEEIDGDNYTVVVKDDEVTVDVKITGTDLANAQWQLDYNPAHFTLITENVNVDEDAGTIFGSDYVTDGEYAQGHTLATYKFKVIGQKNKTKTAFNLNYTYAYTWDESWNPEDFAADSGEPANVMINLIPYEVTIKVDGEVKTGDTCDPIPYDNKPHTFEIVTKPTADVDIKCELDGQPIALDEIKAEGTYKITYTLEDNEAGYDKISGEFILVIDRPDYVVEVNLTEGRLSDYVAGKKLVIVYTKTEGFGFKYNGNEMIDVSESLYEYNNDASYGYTRKFAFVTDAIAGGIKKDYEDLVMHDYDLTCDKILASDYDEDINMDGNYDIRDITSAYGVHNVEESYFTTDVKTQKKLLNTDIDNDKVVRDNTDVFKVVNAIYGN